MIIVLTYHSIADIQYEYAVSPVMFEAQMRMIQRLCTVVSVDELAEYLSGSKKRPAGNIAVVTFDDGIQDNHRNAFPILTKLEIPAMIFIATSLVGGASTLASGQDVPMLTWKEIETMDQSGRIRFGSHTHSHPVLTSLPAESVRAEFVESNRLLSDHLKTPVSYLAYPKGKFNPDVQRVAHEQYRLAFGGSDVIFPEDNIDPMSVARVTVSAHVPLWKFRLLLSPTYWRFKRLYSFCTGTRSGTRTNSG